MAFEGLSEKLAASFKKLRNKGKLSEADVKDAMREVRLALLEADVNYKVARDFTNQVIEAAVGAKVMESLTPAQMVIKIVNEQLTQLMGGEAAGPEAGPRNACRFLEKIKWRGTDATRRTFDGLPFLAMHCWGLPCRSGVPRRDICRLIHALFLW